MLSSSRTMQIHNRISENDRKNYIMLANYGYVPAKDPVVERARFLAAFQALCNKGVTAWPKNTACSIAIKNYNEFIHRTRENSGLRIEIRRNNRPRAWVVGRIQRRKRTPCTQYRFKIWRVAFIEERQKNKWKRGTIMPASRQ